MMPAPAASICAGYQPQSGIWDELHDGQQVRPHWRHVLEQFGNLGSDGLARRADEVARLLRDHGVGHTIFAQGRDRPWSLNPFPLVLAATEWNALAEAVAQRARMVETAVADLMGPQRLLHDRCLPASAVLGNPAFLRACHGAQPAHGRWLTLYSAEILRDGDGHWRLVSDGTRSAAAIGFALENRIVISRVLPEIYRSGQIHRLAGFFLGLRETLKALAPRNRVNPRLAVLTPGPGSESYSEHAFLARYLGYTLVEGADLTVRADGVHLKTLGGLHPVDVMLRRLDDAWCDPLELRGDSLLGVPGLAQAARAGQVALANPLGSGLVDGALLLPGSASLCRALLGEDPLMDAIDSRWAVSGDVAEGADPTGLILRALHAGVPHLGPTATPAARLTSAQRADLATYLRRHPHAAVAQRLPMVATSPVWQDGRLAPRPVMLRLFACADAFGNWTVMPGGLARYAEDGDCATLVASRSGASQDLWIGADAPVPEITLLRAVHAPVDLRRGGSDLPSRVADNLFWFARYGERAEGLCRLLRAAAVRSGDIPESVGGREAACLMRLLARLGHLKPIPGQPRETGSREAQLAALIADRQHPTGLATTLAHLRTAAFAVRDRLSNDTWHIVSQLAEQSTPGRMDPGEAVSHLNRLVMGLAALAGMGSENTTRGPGWRFLDLGRRLERAQFICDLLRATLAEPDGDDALEAVLEVADSAITYRSRYLTSLQAPAVLDLLLTDDTNPRAGAFLLAAIEDHVANLPREDGQVLPTEAERIAMGARTWLRVIDPVALCRRDETGARAELVHVLDHLSADLDRLSDAITNRYLTHARPARQRNA